MAADGNDDGRLTNERWVTDQTYGDPDGVVARLIDSTDAQLWAAEWCRIAREIEAAGDDREVIDEGWMIGWFANALETGRRSADPRTVTVLAIDHGHGTNVTVHKDHDAARAELARFVHSWWAEWIGRTGSSDVPLSGEPPENDDEAVEAYFDAACGYESYWIEDTSIEATP